MTACQLLYRGQLQLQHVHSLQATDSAVVICFFCAAKRQRRCECAATATAAGPKVMLANGLVDYYEVLGVSCERNLLKVAIVNALCCVCLASAAVPAVSDDGCGTRSCKQLL
jgi:hypothetical protein